MNVTDIRQESRGNTTLSTWASMIWKALEARGIDPTPIFKQAGIAASNLDDPLLRIPVSLMTKLWLLAVAATDDAAFGLAVAQQVNPSSFHALGFSALASKNSQDALQRILRYAKVITDSIDIQLHQQGNDMSLVVDTQAGYPQYADACFEALMATPLHFSRAYIQWNPAPDLVCFRHTCYGKIKNYEDFFGCEVLFNQANNSVLFNDYRSLIKDFVTANATLAKANDDVIESYLHSRSLNTTSHSLRNYLAKNLVKKVPSIGLAAKALNMSERKLQQQLKNEGSQFKHILDEVKQAYAIQWLNEGQKSISQIAWDLGFKEVSSFSRAFKCWTGQSPSGFVNIPNALHI